jgi:hypothetical protein
MRAVTVVLPGVALGLASAALVDALNWPWWTVVPVASAVWALWIAMSVWPHLFALPDLRELMFDHALRELSRSTPPGTPVTEAVIALARYHFGVPVSGGEAVTMSGSRAKALRRLATQATRRRPGEARSIYRAAKRTWKRQNRG